MSMMLICKCACTEASVINGHVFARTCRQFHVCRQCVMGSTTMLPGATTPTQRVTILPRRLSIHRCSAGDLLRAEVASGSEMGKELEEIMKEGKLVPSSVTIKLLKKAIATSDGMKFLIDGFPRALDQAEEFEKEVIPCKLVLFFDCPQDVMQERLLKRAETSGRADDNIETIKKRFDTFVKPCYNKSIVGGQI